jgi:hypothetical protein
MNNVRHNGPAKPLGCHDVFNLRAKAVKLSHFNHIIRVYFAARMIVSLSYSSLLGGISHVVKLSSCKQMGWIDAAAPVASVQNTVAFRHLSNMKLVREFVRSAWLSIHMKITMAVLSFRAKPIPTLSEFGVLFRQWSVFVNFGPESLNGVNRWSESVSSHIPKPYAIDRALSI